MSGERLETAKALLARLVAFDSVSDKSNLPVIDFVEDYLQGPRRRRPPRAERLAATRPPSSPPSGRGSRAASCFRAIPTSCRSTASPGRAIRSNCGRSRGRLYGRGACDMKGFDACVLAMVPAFQAAALKRPVHIVLSYDEETTCLGSLDVIAWFGQGEPQARRRHRRRADDDAGRRRA